MAAPFVGNQDFRGYLNYLGTQGDKSAAALLNYVGNDGGYDPNKLTTSDAQNRVAQLYGQYNQLNTPPSPTNIGSIYSGGGAPAPVYAPKLDLAAVNAKARAAAESAVNPFYTKQLNDFLTQQAAQKQQQQAQYNTNVKNIQDQLANTLEQNQLSQTRTGEDVAKNEADIATNADQFQTDSGQAFTQSRLDAARQGSTGGLGQQKQANLQAARNTQEGRQVQQFQNAKQQQELFKSRTFEDLAKSGELAKTNAGKGQAAEKFNLDNYIQNAAFDEQNKRNELEQQRLQAVGQEQGNQSKLLFNNYLAGISNPAQLQAAVQTYGGAF